MSEQRVSDERLKHAQDGVRDCLYELNDLFEKHKWRERLAEGVGAIADARASLATLRARLATILAEARSWACEAETQRATVNEVGSALGGIPDWGPIAKTVRERLTRLAAVERVVEAAKAWRDEKREVTERYGVGVQFTPCARDLIAAVDALGEGGKEEA